MVEKKCTNILTFSPLFLATNFEVENGWYRTGLSKP